MKTTNLKLLTLFFVTLTFTLSGCNRIAFMNDGKKNNIDTITVVPVEDPQLAKLILKPNHKAIEIPRDPFKPIYGQSTPKIDNKVIEPIRNTFSEIYFIGMIKMENQAIALLKIGNKRMMLKLNEQYKGFIVQEIENTHVVFSNGENQITLKRGAKK